VINATGIEISLYISACTFLGPFRVLTQAFPRAIRFGTMITPDMHAHTQDALVKTPVDTVEIFRMAFRTGTILGDPAPQPKTCQFPDQKK
jgi:hypothetical protein